MGDVFTPAKRSAVMALIRSRSNRATELRLIARMREHGIIGWRRNTPVFGKPDFVFRRERVAVFVDGCFWRGATKHATMPATNWEFWNASSRATHSETAPSRAHCAPQAGGSCACGNVH